MMCRIPMCCILTIIVLLSGGEACADPEPASVQTTADLVAALRIAKPGDTIRLAPGTYADVVINGRRFARPVVITSADSRRPAVFRQLTVSASSGLIFVGLEFSTVGDPLSQWGAEATIPFQVDASSDIHFDKLSVHGDPKGTLASDPSGLIVQSSDNVSLTNSEFSYLHNAFEHVDDTHLTVSGNHYHNLRDDSIRGGGSSWVTISGNRFDSNHPDADDPDHPDCIQFWTTNTKVSAHDITITGNIYTRGEGRQVQGIFMRDEVGALPYENVKITGNVIVGALWHGITVYHGHNVTIVGNTVAPYPDQMSWIMLSGGDEITVTDDRAGQFLFGSPDPTHLHTARNTVIPPVKDRGAALLAAWRATR